MMSQIVADQMRKAGKAEVYHGDEVCREKAKLLLREVGLPGGLLPLRDVVECGYVEETGFVWLKQKRKVEHCFAKIGRKVTYAPEITAFVEKSRIKNLTGVKAKELLVWLNVTDISSSAAATADDVDVDDGPPAPVQATSSSGKLTFRTSSGLLRTFPSWAFEPEDDAGEK